MTQDGTRRHLSFFWRTFIARHGKGNWKCRKFLGWFVVLKLVQCKKQEIEFCHSCKWSWQYKIKNCFLEKRHSCYTTSRRFFIKWNSWKKFQKTGFDEATSTSFDKLSIAEKGFFKIRWSSLKKKLYHLL